jgi:hypothetical protein
MRGDGTGKEPGGEEYGGGKDGPGPDPRPLPWISVWS